MAQAPKPPEKHLGFIDPPDKPRDVKSNLLLLGPACLLALLALGVAGLSFQYVQLTRELNRSQALLGQVELRQTRIKALVNECVEYSQRNPKILPVLQTIGLKPTPPSSQPTPSVANPSEKPATR